MRTPTSLEGASSRSDYVDKTSFYLGAYGPQGVAQHMNLIKEYIDKSK